MKNTAEQILDAIAAGFAAGGEDEWDAPEFQAARDLTEAAGCVWDFAGWRDTADAIESRGCLGGVDLTREREAFYGTDVDTFYLDSQGLAWIVSSVDCIVKIKSAKFGLPEDAVALSDQVLDDQQREDAEAIEQRYSPRPA